jgi:predicted PurR-regulated permease PerM
MMAFFGRVRSLSILILFLASVLGGILLSGWLSPPAVGQIEPLPERYKIGQQTYLENCSGCHIPLPASVLPLQSWKHLLENPNYHYGVRLQNMIGITQRLIWDYLSYSSRPLTTDAAVPLFIEQSTYFKALHPRVTFTGPVTHLTCVVCHPNASRYDYRTLTPAWENAP